MCTITEGPLDWNMVSWRTMNEKDPIQSIDMIRSQWIDIDLLSHLCNIASSWSFTRDIASKVCICHDQVTRLKDNEGGYVTTE